MMTPLDLETRIKGKIQHNKRFTGHDFDRPFPYSEPLGPVIREIVEYSKTIQELRLSDLKL